MEEESIKIDYSSDFFEIKKKWDLNTLKNNKSVISFDKLSYSEKVDWDKDILLFFKNDFSSWGLSKNQSIPWDNEIINEFKDILDWEAFAKNRNFKLSYNKYGPTNIGYRNGHTVFSFLKEFGDKCNSNHLIENKSINWGEVAEYLVSSYDKKGEIKSDSIVHGLNNHQIDSLWKKISGSNDVPKHVWERILKNCFDKIDLWYLSSVSSFPWTKEIIDLNIEKWNWRELIELLANKHHYPGINLGEYYKLLKWEGQSRGRTGYHYYYPSDASYLNVNFPLDVLKEKTKNWKEGFLDGGERSNEDPGDWVIYSRRNKKMSLDVLVEFKNKLYFPEIVKQERNWSDEEITFITSFLKSSNQLNLLPEFIKNKSVELFVAKKVFFG